MSTLSERLRAETRDQHAALESALPIASGTPDSDVYREHLRYLLGFHEPLEARLRQVPGLDEAVPDLEQRWKSVDLRDDLGPHAEGPRAAPERLPNVHSAEGALGALYVLEGAILGARTLIPRLRETGVIPGEIGHRYLSGYGGQTSEMWRRFRAALDAVSERSADEVIESARATFDALLAWYHDFETQHERSDRPLPV